MANQYDAFSAGIELGGLRNRKEIRLLVSYLLNSIDEALPRSLISDAILQEGLANYFELNQAYDELIKNGNISAKEVDGEEVLTITDLGRETALLLETNLTRRVRDKAVRSALNLLTIHRREKENKIVIEKQDSGYKITMDIFATPEDKAKEKSLISLSISTSDSLQADRIKEGFLKDPVKLCDVIISTLLEND